MIYIAESFGQLVQIYTMKCKYNQYAAKISTHFQETTEKLQKKQEKNRLTDTLKKALTNVK